MELKNQLYTQKVKIKKKKTKNVSPQSKNKFLKRKKKEKARKRAIIFDETGFVTQYNVIICDVQSISTPCCNQ